MNKNTAKNKDQNNKDLAPSGLDMLEVDLIKEEKKEALNWGKYLSLIFLVLVVSAVLVLEFYWLLGWWENQEKKEIDKISDDIVLVQRKVSELENEYKQLTNYKVKADLANDLLKKHPYWTNFFEWLEKVTLSSVSWESFSGDLSGTYTLSGKTNTFADVSWQVRAFIDNKEAMSVEAVNYTGGTRRETIEVGRFENEDGEEEVITENVLRSDVSFTLNLKVNPNIFYNY